MLVDDMHADDVCLATRVILESDDTMLITDGRTYKNGRNITNENK